MPQCPVCGSFQVVVVVSPRSSAWCDGCGARWIQEGCEQRAIMREPAVLAGRLDRVSLPASAGFSVPRSDDGDGGLWPGKAGALASSGQLWRASDPDVARVPIGEMVAS
jgi:hypothetical protein